MTTLRWLHLTDLHLGMSGQKPLWPNIEEMFLDDLKSLHDRVGPWDLVLFTGDLTQRGTKAEFDEVEKLFQKLWSRFAEWGFTPKLLAIPGNHDLTRPEDKSDPALLTLLHNWQLPEVQKPFWTAKDSAQRKLISNAFLPFTEWWEHTCIPKPTPVTKGLLPGDCSASFETDGLNVGIIGLNSSYLQLTEGNFERRLHMDIRQLDAVCNGHVADWAKQHTVCLLLTHHPTHWLTEDSAKHFSNEIHYPPERFALHLFGHMHEGNLTSMAFGGGNERRSFQGCSLFGLENWGEKDTKRNHGYSLGELKSEGNNLTLRIWPRIAFQKPGGGRRLERDVGSFDLDESDGGTKPVFVNKLRGPDAVATSQPVAPTPKRAAQYDMRNPPFYVPYHQKGDQVIGRENSLAMVRQQLTAGRRTTIGQTAVFQGLGGLGKTQLAVEYAYLYRDSYPNGVIWLTADQDIDAQLVDLAVKATWVAPESEHSHKLEVARRRLRSFSDCLIIFDNLEQITDIQSYLPEYPAEPHLLATSRTEQPDFTYLPIDVLDPDQSLRLLIQESGRHPETESDRVAAQTIATLLGGLPLALELAGAYLSRRPVHWPDYLALLQKNLKGALSYRFASLTGHAADLYSTLQISQQVFDEEPRLRDVLNVLTWSAPTPMGLDLLSSLLGIADPTELTGALGLGVALRILQRTPGTDGYSIHRLVREVRREEFPLTDNAAWAAEVCGRIADWFGALREHFAQLARFEAEIDHLREWHKHSLLFAPKQSSELTWLQAYPAFHRGQHQKIKQFIELALDEYQRNGCDNRGLFAHLLNDMAYAIDGLGDSKDALKLAEQALAIRQELFGKWHAETASSLHNVSGYYEALGNPKHALKLAEQALAIRRDLFGEQHPDTANSLNNVAGYHGELGNPKYALELAEQGLAIQRRLFGELHPDTAVSLSNVAGYYNELGNPKHALELAEQGLATRRELFGELHPATAQSLNNVAAYYNSLGNPRDALKLAEQALAIRRKLFGERHPDTANSLNNVAGYYNALEQPKYALELSEQALAIRRELFGERHPDTANSLNNVAGYYNDLGNPTQALKLAEQALTIQRELFGELHPDTANILSNVARCQNVLGNPKQALKLTEQALTIQRELFGELHPSTAHSLHNMASIFQSMGNGARAHALAQEAFGIRKRVLFANHPDTLSTINLLRKIPGFRAPAQQRRGAPKKKNK